MKFVIGLGEPSDNLLASRGNVGAMVVEALAEKHGIAKLEPSRAIPTLEIAHYEGRESVMICKSLLAPKEAGKVVALVVEKFGLYKKDVILVHDDVDFPLGQVRLRDSGGDGGHDGVRAVMAELGKKDFLRIRIGVGRGAKKKARSEYLNEKFSKDETGRLLKMIYSAASAVDFLIENGLRATQKKFHHQKEGDETAWVSEMPPTTKPNPVQVYTPVPKNPIPRNAIIHQQQSKTGFLEPHSVPTWPGATASNALETAKTSPTELKLLPAPEKKKIEVERVFSHVRPLGSGCMMRSESHGCHSPDWRSIKRLSGFDFDEDGQDHSEPFINV